MTSLMAGLFPSPGLPTFAMKKAGEAKKPSLMRRLTDRPMAAPAMPRTVIPKKSAGQPIALAPWRISRSTGSG
jgi:hypothetical protein